jgi:hypothetical protein
LEVGDVEEEELAGGVGGDAGDGAVADAEDGGLGLGEVVGDFEEEAVVVGGGEDVAGGVGGDGEGEELAAGHEGMVADGGEAGGWRLWQDRVMGGFLMPKGRASRPLEPEGFEGDLSKFVEDAVNRRLLQCTMQDIRARNAERDAEEIEALVEEAVREVRVERRGRGKAQNA